MIFLFSLMINDSCERSESEPIVKLIGKLYHFFRHIIRVSRGTITGDQPPKRLIINSKARIKNCETFTKALNWKEILVWIICGLFYYYAICYNNKMHNNIFGCKRGRHEVL